MRKRALCIAASLLFCAAALPGCTRAELRSRDEYGRFGAQVRWVYPAAEEGDADAIWSQLTALSAEIEASVSSAERDSAVSRFNRAAAGTSVTVGARAFSVFGTAAAVYAETGGAYDPAVGLLVDLWGFSPRHRAVDYRPAQPYDRQDFEKTPPEEKFLTAFSASALRDFSAVTLSEAEGCYTLSKPDAVARVDGKDYTMQLSLDGIGKGACVDGAAEILRAAGVRCGYYNAGGSSLYVLENPARQDGMWEIAVNSPREALGMSYATLTVKNTTVSTSGDYEQYYEIGGVRYCHIIGRDGVPVGAGSHILCATVVGGTAAEGDARATALVAMGKEEALEYASAHADAFRVMFVWYDAEADEYTLCTNLDASQYTVTAAFDGVEAFA